MADQPKDPMYYTLLELAKLQIVAAFEAFKRDERIPWAGMAGSVPKVQHQVFVDALKESVTHHEQIERLLS
jgi:hypothetical protein